MNKFIQELHDLLKKYDMEIIADTYGDCYVEHRTTGKICIDMDTTSINADELEKHYDFLRP